MNEMGHRCSQLFSWRIKEEYDLPLLKYDMLHSGRDPEAGTHFPVASQTDIGLPDMT